MHQILLGVVGAAVFSVVRWAVKVWRQASINRAHGDALVELGWIRATPGAFPDPPAGRDAMQKIADIRRARQMTGSAE